MRFLPHPPNFTPVLSIALFSGFYFKKTLQSFLIPISIMLLSDAIIGFHSTMFFVYFSVLLTILIGMYFLKQTSAFKIASTSLLSSCLFFIITNFGAWAIGGFYAKTMIGLFACFISGIPFFYNEVLGTSLYTFLLFSTYHYAIKSKLIKA